MWKQKRGHHSPSVPCLLKHVQIDHHLVFLNLINFPFHRFMFIADNTHITIECFGLEGANKCDLVQPTAMGWDILKLGCFQRWDVHYLHGQPMLVFNTHCKTTFLYLSLPMPWKTWHSYIKTVEFQFSCGSYSKRLEREILKSRKSHKLRVRKEWMRNLYWK